MLGVPLVVRQLVDLLEEVGSLGVGELGLAEGFTVLRRPLARQQL
jgi:hypothetical protein